jgi:hypothetical protein
VSAVLVLPAVDSRSLGQQEVDAPGAFHEALGQVGLAAMEAEVSRVRDGGFGAGEDGGARAVDGVVHHHVLDVPLAEIGGGLHVVAAAGAFVELGVRGQAAVLVVAEAGARLGAHEVVLWQVHSGRLDGFQSGTRLGAGEDLDVVLEEPDEAGVVHVGVAYDDAVHVGGKRVAAHVVPVDVGAVWDESEGGQVPRVPEGPGAQVFVEVVVPTGDGAELLHAALAAEALAEVEEEAGLAIVQEEGVASDLADAAVAGELHPHRGTHGASGG